MVIKTPDKNKLTPLVFNIGTILEPASVPTPIKNNNRPICRKICEATVVSEKTTGPIFLIRDKIIATIITPPVKPKEKSNFPIFILICPSKTPKTIPTATGK